MHVDFRPRPEMVEKAEGNLANFGSRRGARAGDFPAATSRQPDQLPGDDAESPLRPGERFARREPDPPARNQFLLCLISPTCFGQFDHGQAKVSRQFGEDFHTPPLYDLQLLAFAQGAPYDKLGFERQRFKPECLRRFETVASLAAG